jgi:FkbM family methyltransferase
MLAKARDRADWLRFARVVRPEPIGPVAWLGSPYGGYAIPEGVVNSDWICYCAGLGEDISFELELIRRYDCSVYAFDPTPRSIDYVRPIADTTAGLHLVPCGLWAIDSVERFYEPQDRNHVSHSIANLQQTSRYIEVECRSIVSLMRQFGHDEIHLLKLDVEGAEYRILEQLRELDIRPRVLCIDFHRTTSLDAMTLEIDRLRSAGYRPVHVYRTDVTLVASARTEAR